MNKCIFVVDNTLPIGLIANTCAVLALSLGKNHPELVGHDLHDKDGDMHPGITTIVMPILGSTKEDIAMIREKAKGQAHYGLQVIDVSNIAQQTKTYSDYVGLLKETSSEQLQYFGICLFGATQLIKSLTGSLSLLR
ncbi:MAG: DUF2000 domain-containing protein [Glaciimonas sp.]|nr:DUF2000 domain-containing protein [Glaciimonas sp.]